MRRRCRLPRCERAGGLALIDDVGPGPVGVDTAVFIYFIEEHERFLPAITPLFAAADAGKFELVASALTLLEAARRSLPRRQHRTRRTLRGCADAQPWGPYLDLSRDHLRLAAQVRAATGAATPDALQLAASVGTRCSAFVTNDRRLPTVPGLRIIQLGAYVV